MAPTVPEPGRQLASYRLAPGPQQLEHRMIVLWIAFIALILFILALDLGVFHRQAHVVPMREALGWTAIWVTLSLLFSVFVYFAYDRQWFGIGALPDPLDGVVNDGKTATVKYLTGYIVEQSLSMDNVFVIAMIFAYFQVPPIYQHRVLFWGVLGALVMRGVMIAVGVRLVTEFHWLLYVFGAFLLATGLKMLLMKEQGSDLSRNPVLRLARRWFPVTTFFHGEHFVVRAGTAAACEGATPGAAPVTDPAVTTARPHALMLTPLALALIAVETTDLIFAVDSIPAIFAITADPFLIFTSNVFAILGLRSLYFALAGLLDKFRYLKPALALVLLTIGVKMLAAEWFKALLGRHFSFYLLGLILAILAGGVVTSLLADRAAVRRAAQRP